MNAATQEVLKKLTAADSAWRQWHGDMDEDDIPRMNPSFERGFLAGVQWAIGQEQEENA